MASSSRDAQKIGRPTCCGTPIAHFVISSNTPRMTTEPGRRNFTARLPSRRKRRRSIGVKPRSKMLWIKSWRNGSGVPELQRDRFDAGAQQAAKPDSRPVSDRARAKAISRRANPLHSTPARRERDRFLYQRNELITIAALILTLTRGGRLPHPLQRLVALIRRLLLQHAER